MLKPSTASMIARPGKITIQGACSMKPRPSASIRPSDGVGGRTPTPRNDSEASTRMAIAISTEAWTSTGVAALGRMWRSTSRGTGGAERAGAVHVDLDLGGEDGGAHHARDDGRVDDGERDAATRTTPVPKTLMSAMASRMAGKAMSTSSGRMMSWSGTPSA